MKKIILPTLENQLIPVLLQRAKLAKFLALSTSS